MKRAGEAVAIDRTFKENLQKCLRSLETRWPCATSRSGLGGDGKLALSPPAGSAMGAS